MKERERPPYQRRFGEEGELERYLFPKGTMIWPETSGRGVLTEGCYAERLPPQIKIKGLTGFQSCGPLHLYFDRKYWTLPQGTRFGACLKNAKRVKIK